MKGEPLGANVMLSEEMRPEGGGAWWEELIQAYIKAVLRERDAAAQATLLLPPTAVLGGG